MGAVSAQDLLFSGALAFWFLIFLFPIFSANAWYRAHRAHMPELPRCALYLSEWEQYPPMAYYLLSLWLFGFLIFLFFHFSANAWARAHRTLHDGTSTLRAISWRVGAVSTQDLLFSGALAFWFLIFEFSIFPQRMVQSASRPHDGTSPLRAIS